jgi:hypothetical protein
VALCFCLLPRTSHAQLSSYTQNFEAMSLADPAALSANGWLVYVEDWDVAHNELGGYTLPAANGGNAVSKLVMNYGGATQGLQQLMVYSNYNDRTALNAFVETYLYREQTIAAADAGKAIVFRFDAARSDWYGAAYGPSATAFLRVVNPAQGGATTLERTVDMTNAAQAWTTYELTLQLDPSLAGQNLQFGFSNWQTGFDPTLVLYDNLLFVPDQALPATPATWGQIKGRYR